LILTRFYSLLNIKSTIGAVAVSRGLNRACRELRLRFAARLRVERHGRGLSQEQAAEAAGLALAHYQRIEWSKVNVPLDTLCRLAVAFGVDPARLLAPVEPSEAVPKGFRVDQRPRAATKAKSR
jgi:DNA-binding XRE family transcriptional regulator